MKNEDKKIEIDLAFLDERSSKPKQLIQKDEENVSEVTNVGTWKRNWKTILIASSLVFVVVLIAAIEDGGTSVPNTAPASSSATRAESASSSEDDVEYGEYRCSRYHYDKAVALSPTENEQSIKNTQLSMDSRSNELDRLKNEIEYSEANEYSPQYVIDAHNEKINAYNSKLAAYKLDAANLDSRIDKFNSQVAAHNDYLVRNCSPR